MKRVLFLCLLFGLFGGTGFKAKAQNDMFKALFMYNFTKNIDWPHSYKTGDFVIGVLGNSSLIPELERIAKRKKAGMQKIIVAKYNTIEQIKNCHIIYIPASKSSKLNKVIKTLKTKPTLIITDKNGLARKGSCINYITIDGDQKFEINADNLRNKGLKVTKFLLSLAVLVQ